MRSMGCPKAWVKRLSKAFATTSTSRCSLYPYDSRDGQTAPGADGILPAVPRAPRPCGLQVAVSEIGVLFLRAPDERKAVLLQGVEHADWAVLHRDREAELDDLRFAQLGRDAREYRVRHVGVGDDLAGVGQRRLLPRCEPGGVVSTQRVDLLRTESGGLDSRGVRGCPL